MSLFEGKSKEEKYKIIAAVVLGTLAVIAVGYNLLGLFQGRKTPTTTSSATPSPARPTNSNDSVARLPEQSEIDSIYSTIPVVYPLTPTGAPDAGRNIFAFYEPPPPTPWSPTPPTTPTIIPKTPPPTPEPPLKVYGFSPASVFAGTSGFDIQVSGAGFTPETRIFFNGTELPTKYYGPDRLSAQIPSNYIASSGQKQIFLRTPDGKLYSEPTFFNVEAAPRPTFQYVGIVAPKLGNNATAYLQEGTATPLPKRLDDRVGVCAGDSAGCFRLVSISRDRVIVQDVKLGFRYTVDIVKPSSSSQSTTTFNPRNDIRTREMNPLPNVVNPAVNPNNPDCPPGIPCNLPRYQPNQNANPQQRDQKQKKDVDDDGDDGDN